MGAAEADAALCLPFLSTVLLSSHPSTVIWCLFSKLFQFKTAIFISESKSSSFAHPHSGQKGYNLCVFLLERKTEKEAEAMRLLFSCKLTLIRH